MGRFKVTVTSQGDADRTPTAPLQCVCTFDPELLGPSSDSPSVAQGAVPEQDGRELTDVGSRVAGS
jgi:hypothetical protein